MDIDIDKLKPQIQSLPHQPGVCQYFDKDDKILYVGKAKDIKKRVASYFNKTQENGKTQVLVKKIDRIEHIVRLSRKGLSLSNYQIPLVIHGVVEFQ